MRTVVISGVPGVGKSTALDILSQGYVEPSGGLLYVAPEPVERWEDCLGRYLCGGASALELQSAVLLAFHERDRKIKDAIASLAPNPDAANVVILERDHADATLFCLTMHEMGSLSNPEFSLLMRLSGALFRDKRPEDARILLRAGVDTALERVRSRGRSCESEMEQDYMATLSRIHEETAEGAAWQCIDTDGTDPKGVAASIASIIGLVPTEA